VDGALELGAHPLGFGFAKGAGFDFVFILLVAPFPILSFMLHIVLARSPFSHSSILAISLFLQQHFHE
jgi:hypothetical protein